MKITLIRHGETDFNKADKSQGWYNSKLTKQGIRQAKQLAKFLKNEKFDAIYSSDSERAWDTAKEIAKFFPNIKIKISKKLREQSKGIYEGKPRSILLEARIKHGKENHWDFVPEKGESYEQVFKRVWDFIKKILEKDNKHIAIISHGGPINLFLGHITKTPKEKIKKFSHKNTAFSVINYNKDRFKVLKINSTEHLK